MNICRYNDHYMPSEKKFLVFITGPTAVGKTELSIKLAQKLNSVILSADSRQFYRELSIGTAKPDFSERRLVPHYFVNHLPIQQPYTVRQYEVEGIHLLRELFKRKPVVVVSGGSGLFADALCYGLDAMPAIPASIRSSLQKEMETGGLEMLVQELKAVDPEYANQADLKNPRRVIRALEVYRSSGRPFSAFRKEYRRPNPLFTPLWFGLTMERGHLYQRINRRVDAMMAAGLLEEVSLFRDRLHLPALQTVGYREFGAYFQNEQTLQETVELIKRNTRRYAKRQLTWFRKNAAIQWYDALQPSHLLAEEMQVRIAREMNRS